LKIFSLSNERFERVKWRIWLKMRLTTLLIYGPALLILLIYFISRLYKGENFITDTSIFLMLFIFIGLAILLQRIPLDIESPL